MLREGTTDHKTLVEIKRAYTWMPVKDKKVLDIGGCFGGYSRHAVDKGAKEVWVFEPEQNNCDTIHINLEDTSITQVTVWNYAVVNNNDKEIPFYLTTSGKSCGNYSYHKYRGRKEIRVKTKEFNEILEEFQPDVIKMDCEGAEYDLLKIELPQCVKYFTMELHFTSPSTVKPNWLERAPEIIKQFESWKVIKQPKLSPKLWQTIGAWSR